VSHVTISLICATFVNEQQCSYWLGDINHGYVCLMILWHSEVALDWYILYKWGTDGICRNNEACTYTVIQQCRSVTTILSSDCVNDWMDGQSATGFSCRGCASNHLSTTWPPTHLCHCCYGSSNDVCGRLSVTNLPLWWHRDNIVGLVPHLSSVKLHGHSGLNRDMKCYARSISTLGYYMNTNRQTDRQQYRLLLNGLHYQ